MADEVTVYGLEGSPFDCRVKIVLNLKGINYKFIREDLSNKSADLLKYNPVYEKIPVLLHNGKPIAETALIIEYIDEVWKAVPVLPKDAYERAQARFWVRFIEDTCTPALFKAIGSHGQEQAVAQAHAQLQFLENELNRKGNKFFGGDNINTVDIAGTFIAHWLGAAEEALDIKILDEDKFPKLTEWVGNFTNSQVVKNLLPPREGLVPFYRKKFAKPQ